MQEMPRQTEFAPIKIVVEKTQWKADTQQKKKLNFSDSVLMLIAVKVRSLFL